jgi:NAD(P)-dependent dehydrogenase (short-subunit alcohol dehydrogenase family)
VADVKVEQGKQVAEKIGGAFVEMDVWDEAKVEAAANQIFSKYGPVTGVVTSAGVLQPPVPPEQLDMKIWDGVVQIDQRGTYLTCRAFGSHMAKNGGGSIVNIASIAGSRSLPLHSYSPAKAAVISMSACLAAAWGRKNVRVNSVSPGATLTPALQAEVDAGRRDISRFEENSTLGLLVQPEEIGEAVAFLLSRAASAITGIDLPVDCGWLAGSTWHSYGGIR